MIFNGRNEVPFYYSAYGYTRGGGTTFHGGIDIVGLDDDGINMPSYKGERISGTVVASAFIPQSTGNATWEWGNYICVQLNANATPDDVNYLYFCHNKSNLVKVGDSVTTGDKLAVMGNTGNAAYASPPIEHVHFEVRAQRTGKGLDPTAYAMVENKAGIYENEQVSQEVNGYTGTVLVSGLRLRTLPDTEDTTQIITTLEKDKTYPMLQTKNGWAFLQSGTASGGWACIAQNGVDYILIDTY